MPEHRRVPEFDRAKGIAIILIVALHVGPGLIASGLMPDNVAMRFAEAWAYSFHVQVFFLIAGYLAWPRFTHWRFHAERFVGLYYPYLMWSGLSVALAIAIGGANHSLGWREFFWLPLMPQLQFWFVPALLTTTLAAGLIGRDDCLLLGLGAAGLVLSPGAYNWVQAGTYFPFLCLGVIMARHQWLVPTPAPLAVLTGAISLGGTWIGFDYGWTFKDPIMFPVGLCGCHALFALARVIDRGKTARALAYLGRKSLAIYLAHGLFATAARIAWIRTEGPNAPWVAFIACSAIGVTGPLALDAFAGRMHLGEVIGLSPLRLWRDRSPR
jgi:fucose 4-O-acetylase-like acetyltransferase